eukprot:CAMPEP_0183359224 /NCGR_PEP_ID=MMETSP0164_2-20130417/51513_1 /TAXON_ID=221442 /ORGANISM="Coccolithus pelagicus ssp braarudi, Strain PLY182g" /LENGTH=114 /DNA_ID=CAMNT_0025533287 /DNA_START=323 /DNA_END=667 /DNA_ORIENTATION=-
MHQQDAMCRQSQIVWPCSQPRDLSIVEALCDKLIAFPATLAQLEWNARIALRQPVQQASLVVADDQLASPDVLNGLLCHTQCLQRVWALADHVAEENQCITTSTARSCHAEKRE